MNGAPIVLEIARVEASHLTALISQFTEVLDDPDATNDPAVSRLAPDAYRDDPAASREFRRLTATDSMTRRREDARVVLTSLADAVATDPDDESAMLEMATFSLDPGSAMAWLRTLAAVRLVLATRLGVDVEDSHDVDDPRFAIYDWLGYRLDVLVDAVDRSTRGTG